jgi:hypothetical protein
LTGAPVISSNYTEINCFQYTLIDLQMSPLNRVSGGLIRNRFPYRPERPGEIGSSSRGSVQSGLNGLAPILSPVQVVVPPIS